MIFSHGLLPKEQRLRETLSLNMRSSLTHFDSRSDMEMRPIISSLTALAGLLSTFSTLSEPYIELTTSHFTDTASSNITSVEAGTMSATRYVEWTLQKITEERERAEACISSEVAQDIVKVIRDEAGTKWASRFVRTGQRQISSDLLWQFEM